MSPLTLVSETRNRANFRQLALRGRRLADAWIPRYQKPLARELRRQWEEGARAYMEGGLPAIENLVNGWAHRLHDIEVQLGFQQVVANYRWARQAFFGEEGKQEFLYDVSEEVFEAEELLAYKFRPKLARRLRETVTVESRTTVRKMARKIEFWRNEQKTTSQIGRLLRKEGLVDARSRSVLLARTSSMWNYNEASKQAFTSMGIQVGEWAVAADERLCEFCMTFDGMRFRLEEPVIPADSELVSDEGNTLHLPYAVEHPPLHPLCRCCMIPVVEDIVIREAEAIARAAPPVPITPDIRTLLNEYETAKRVGDKVGLRKLRRQLRKKGHYLSQQKRGVTPRVKPRKPQVEPGKLPELPSDFRDPKVARQFIDMRFNVTGDQLALLNDEAILEVASGARRAGAFSPNTFTMHGKAGLRIFKFPAKDRMVFAYVRGRTVSLNAEYWAAEKWSVFKRMLARNAQNKWLVGATPADNMAHEMGHIIFQDPFGQLKWGGRSGVSGTAKQVERFRVLSRSRRGVGTQLSKYAKTNPQETWSEVVSDYSAHGPKGMSQFSLDLLERVGWFE